MLLAPAEVQVPGVQTELLVRVVLALVWAWQVVLALVWAWKAVLALVRAWEVVGKALPALVRAWGLVVRVQGRVWAFPPQRVPEQEMAVAVLVAVPCRVPPRRRHRIQEMENHEMAKPAE